MTGVEFRRSHVVADQVRAAYRRIACHDRGVAYAGKRGEAVAYFVGFDPVAADLHLVVGAAEVFEVAVGQPAGQVAGTVETAAGDEGVGEEALGVQLRPVQVAAGDADASYI